MRPFGDLKIEYIQNEMRAIVKLCEGESHRNIVAVLNHGKLAPSYYYIDMQFCDMNLEMYIQQRWTPEIEQTVPQFTSYTSPQSRMSQIWKIMQDITNGLKFIHSHKEIHRDLKPRNSKPKNKSFLLIFSIIL